MTPLVSETIITDDEQIMNDFVGKYGLEVALKNIRRIANILQLEIPRNNGHTNGYFTEAPFRYNSHGKRITEIRHQGGLSAWVTRRAVDIMVKANPRLSRMSALALYRDENSPPPVILIGPRKNGTRGEKVWDSRILNQIEKAATKGVVIDWEEGHHRAVDSLRGLHHSDY